MHLGFNFFSSLFFLSQFNLYAIVLFLLLGCFLDKFNGDKLQLKAKFFLVKSSGAGLSLLIFLLMVCLVISLWFVRGLELSLFSGGLSLTSSSVRWLLFVCVFGFFTGGVLLTTSAVRLSFSFVEFFSAIFLLLQVWSWVSLQTNWLAVLLFLEIAALLLLLFSTYTQALGSSGITSPYNLAESNQSVNFNFLKFFIFFLWLSVSATFFFFWALALAYSSWLGFDLHAIYLFNSYLWGGGAANAPATNIFMGFIGLGFLCKLLLIPLQGLLFSLYNTFSFNLFLLYLVLYYFFFLFVAFLVFGLVFYIFWGGWALVILWLALFSLFSLLSCLMIETDLRQVFATSSVVNLTLIFLFIL